MTKTTVDSAAQCGQQHAIVIGPCAYREMADRLARELEESVDDMRAATELASDVYLRGLGVLDSAAKHMPETRALVSSAANAAQDAAERLAHLAGKVRLLAQLAPHVGEVRS